MLDGFNHVAILTADLDRLEGFYRDMFGVEDVRHMDHNGLRHRLIRIGTASVLHAFEVGDAPPPAPIFERGRIDHLALNVTDPDEFDRLSSRLVAGGAGDGSRTDFGVLVSVSFTDPDGHFCELCWMRPTASLADARDPA